MKQTAVVKALENLKRKRDNFIGNHKDNTSISESKGFLQGLDWAIDTLEQAKEMEEQQKKDTFDYGLLCEPSYEDEAEQYYNETFKSE